MYSTVEYVGGRGQRLGSARVRVNEVTAQSDQTAESDCRAYGAIVNRHTVMYTLSDTSITDC